MLSCEVVYRVILTRLTFKNSIYEWRKVFHWCEAYWAPQKLLPLRWHLFVGGGSRIVTGIFAHKGGLYVEYGCMSMHSPWILQVAWPKIIDAPLTHHWRTIDALLTHHWRAIDAALRLSFRTYLRCCCRDYWLEWRPVVWLWVNVAARSFDFPTCKATNRSHFVDAHFQDIVAVLPAAVLPRKAADNTITE